MWLGCLLVEGGKQDIWLSSGCFLCRLFLCLSTAGVRPANQPHGCLSCPPAQSCMENPGSNFRINESNVRSMVEVGIDQN
mmetsp:Transcript_14083/g.25148  ORF Transcript_14083/g.25148 Transcript_14083/m.25148 type:complete len:80 (+) Transcript_14083:252-491(+)